MALFEISSMFEIKIKNQSGEFYPITENVLNVLQHLVFANVSLLFFYPVLHRYSYIISFLLNI